MTRAMIVTEGGKVHVTNIEGDLSTLQALVGGPIEFFHISEDVHAYLNEEGKFDPNCAPNPTATAILGLTGHDVVMGAVVFLGEGEDGEEGDLPEHFIQTYRNLIGENV